MNTFYLPSTYSYPYSSSHARIGADALESVVHMRPIIFIAAPILYGTSIVTASPQNITVDDEFGDQTTGLYPQYSNSGSLSWSQGSTCESMFYALFCRLQTCLYVGSAGCEASVEVDASQTLDGTWHDATGTSQNPVSIQIQFTGEKTLILLFTIVILTGTHVQVSLSTPISSLHHIFSRAHRQ